MDKLDSFCGCIALRTGCFIVGSLYLIEAVLYIIYLYPMMLFTALIIWIIMISVLFVGLQKNLSGYLLAYLIYDVVYSAFSLWYIVNVIADALGILDVAFILGPNVGVVYLCYRIFCWFVIRSQYITMKLEEQNIQPTTEVETSNDA